MKGWEHLEKELKNLESDSKESLVFSSDLVRINYLQGTVRAVRTILKQVEWAKEFRDSEEYKEHMEVLKDYGR